jgi:hypothetical protein
MFAVLGFLAWYHRKRNGSAMPCAHLIFAGSIKMFDALGSASVTLADSQGNILFHTATVGDFNIPLTVLTGDNYYVVTLSAMTSVDGVGGTFEPLVGYEDSSEIKIDPVP